MTRIIKASEVKPGMEVEFTLTRRMTIHKNVEGDYSERELEDVSGSIVFVGADTQVTVLSEPAPVQPEEPTWAGAKVLAGVHRFLRCGQRVKPWRRVLSNGAVGSLAWSWSEVCSRGQVTVVPDQGWTVPDDAPEDPERIEDWPEDDHALRASMWWDRYRCVWMWNAGYSKWECHNAAGDYLRTIVRPVCGPWTRVTDA